MALCGEKVWLISCLQAGALGLIGVDGTGGCRERNVGWVGPGRKLIPALTVIMSLVKGPIDFNDCAKYLLEAIR